MALIKCPECGKEVSDKAPACIHCGFPLSELKTHKEVNALDEKVNSSSIQNEKDSFSKLIEKIYFETKLYFKNWESIEFKTDYDKSSHKRMWEKYVLLGISSHEENEDLYKGHLYKDQEIIELMYLEIHQHLKNFSQNKDMYNEYVQHIISELYKLYCTKGLHRMCPIIVYFFNYNMFNLETYKRFIEALKVQLKVERELTAYTPLIAVVDKCLDENIRAELKNILELDENKVDWKTRAINGWKDIIRYAGRNDSVFTFQLEDTYASLYVPLHNTKQVENNVPKCPTCGSTKLSKVSVASKAGSVFMWGLLSQKVKKTWHCNNCSYEW